MDKVTSTRCTITRLSEGGYVVTNSDGGAYVFATASVDTALKFIRDAVMPLPVPMRGNPAAEHTIRPVITKMCSCGASGPMILVCDCNGRRKQ